MHERHHSHWPVGLPHSLPPSNNSIFQNLVDAVVDAPNATAIEYYGAHLTYSELLLQTNAIAGYLDSHAQVAADDRVIVYMQNSPQFIVAYYAILAANAVVVPVNPMCKRAELEHIVRDSGARTIFFGAELSDEVEAVANVVDSLHRISTHYGDYAGLDLLETQRVPKVVKDRCETKSNIDWVHVLEMDCSPPLHERGPDDWCAIPYSSGTTGKPKGCLHTHRSVNATVRCYPSWVGLQKGSRILATLPFCHVTGMQHSMNLPILTGSTIYLMTRWDAHLAADLIERERIQHWRSITTMMIDFLSLPDIADRDLSSLQAVGGGGAQMPESIARKLQELLSLDYIEAYGLTETMAALHMNPIHAPRKQCLGIPLFGVDSRIFDPTSFSLLGPNETGEIITAAPQLFEGYWNRPEDDKAAFIEIDGKRFFRTGDLGYFDDDGFFYFVDRLKRMINVSGLKVWPAEVEAILHGHPDIAEACVVADADPRTGEAVRAVIVAAPGSAELAQTALTDWCRENMAAYKVPKRFEFRSTLPRSSAGKVLWKEL